MIETFEITLAGLEKRIARLADAAARAINLTPVWNWVHALLLSEMAQQFLTQGAHFLGTQWAPIQPDTEIAKARTYGEPPPPLGVLYASGALFESLTNQGSAGHVFQAQAQAMTFGTQVIYAQYHQKGAQRGNWVLPQRRILKMTDRFKKRVFRVTVAYILKGTLPPAGGGESLGV